MKKTIFILASLALMASACTKSEVIDRSHSSEQETIAFSAYAARATKAAQVDVDNTNLTSFEASAVGNGAVYFDDVTFSKNTVWESSPVYFWPAYALDFFAYNTPASAAVFTPEVTASSQTIFVAPAPAIADQEDLVASYASGKKESDATSAEQSLPLVFNHYLTQVIVKAKNSNPTYKVMVESVKLANLAGDGTYTFSDNTMTATAGKVNSGTSVDYTAGFTAKELGAEAREVMTDAGKGRWYLIPQKNRTAWNRADAEGTSDMTNSSHGTYLALKVKITANNDALNIYPSDGSYAWMAVPVPDALLFEQGKRYNVTVDFFSPTGNGAGYVDPEDPGELDGDTLTDDSGKKIIGGVIRFNATVNTWDDVDITISL